MSGTSEREWGKPFSGNLGEIQRQRRNSTGTVSSLHRVGPGVFRLICEEHGHGVTKHSYSAAYSEVVHPERFCPDCRKIADLPPLREALGAMEARGNVSRCWCGARHHALVTLAHVDLPGQVMRLCPACFTPGSAARLAWEELVAEAKLARKATYKGMSKKERKQAMNRSGLHAFPGKRKAKDAPLIEEAEEEVYA